MVLSVHTLVGGALGAAMNVSPALSLFVGIISHFALDAIPHADYPLHSIEKDGNGKGTLVKDRRFVRDLAVYGLDLIVGFTVLFLFTHGSPNFWAVLAGAVGGCIPDGLQFLHLLFPKIKGLGAFQKLHDSIHTPRRISLYVEKHAALAFLTQASIVVFALYSLSHVVRASS